MVYGRDFFRDTKVRYLGYANEIGEALRPMIDVKFVRYSYGIAFGYVLADVVDKAVGRFLSSGGRPSKVLWATGDALIWQSLASLVIPGIAINRIVHYSNIAIAKHYPKIPQNIRVKMTVGIGLASIPVIIYPIDLAVHALMNLTYRRYYTEELPESQGKGK